VSSVFIIPAGVVVIIAVFLLGYYVGKNRTAQDAVAERLPALPEVMSSPAVDKEKEEFTFYRTLTEKGDKTLSIELKTKPPSAAPSSERALETKTESGKIRTSNSEKPGAARQHAAKTAPPAQKHEAPSQKQAVSKIRYTIQIGSYPDRNMAEEEMRSIKKRGYAAFLVASAIPDKGTWYRVRIGSFSNKQSAEKLAAELKSKEGVSSFITVE